MEMEGLRAQHNYCMTKGQGKKKNKNKNKKKGKRTLTLTLTLISSSTCLIGVFDLGGVARAAGLGGRLEVPGRPLP